MSEVHIILIGAMSSSLGGGPSPKGTISPILLNDLDISGYNIWAPLLDRLNALQDLPFIPVYSHLPCSRISKRWASDLEFSLPHLNKSLNPSLHW